MKLYILLISTIMHLTFQSYNSFEQAHLQQPVFTERTSRQARGCFCLLPVFCEDIVPQTDVILSFRTSRTGVLPEMSRDLQVGKLLVQISLNIDHTWPHEGQTACVKQTLVAKKKKRRWKKVKFKTYSGCFNRNLQLHLSFFSTTLSWCCQTFD